MTLPAVLTTPDPVDLPRLHARLADAAADRGVLDVAYRTLDSPIGTLLLAVTSTGLVRLGLPAEDPDEVLMRLSTRIGPRILHAPGRLDAVSHQLEEYFAGRRRRFEFPVDLRLATGFHREVLTHLADVPFGATRTYTQLARAAGRPSAVRAAGTACARNPVPVVVPCHRVLRADGSLGGYLGGLEAKRTLLALEGVTVPA